MSLINSFTHIQENWKFVIICVQNQWELCTHDMAQLPTCEGDIRISQNLMKNFEKSYLLNGLSNIVTFFTVWFLKIFCIKWIHIYFWVQCSFKVETLLNNQSRISSLHVFLKIQKNLGSAELWNCMSCTGHNLVQITLFMDIWKSGVAS